MSPEELVAEAVAARRRAYCPYSRFPVGAAILTKGGHVYRGCNVENVSSGLTMCAERVAAFAAVCSGETDWQALAVVTEDGSMPCGACLQVLAEFAGPDLSILVAHADGRYRTWKLGELLPHPFASRLVKGDA